MNKYILTHKKPIFLFTFRYIDLHLCVRGGIDQMSTNTSSYTICSAPNVYIFVYILIETRIAPLIYEYCVSISSTISGDTMKFGCVFCRKLSNYHAMH